MKKQVAEGIEVSLRGGKWVKEPQADWRVKEAGTGALSLLSLNKNYAFQVIFS